MKLLSLFLFPLLLLAQDAASSPMKNNRALRRHREVRGLNGIRSSSLSSKRHQNQTFKMNGRKYFVKKDRQNKRETNKKEQINKSRKANDAPKNRIFKFNRQAFKDREKNKTKNDGQRNENEARKETDFPITNLLKYSKNHKTKNARPPKQQRNEARKAKDAPSHLFRYNRKPGFLDSLEWLAKGQEEWITSRLISPMLAS